MMISLRSPRATSHELRASQIIAYDLGIAHATVRVSMARAAAKLGVRSRDEVISAYLAACGGEATVRRSTSGIRS